MGALDCDYFDEDEFTVIVAFAIKHYKEFDPLYKENSAAVIRNALIAGDDSRSRSRKQEQDKEELQRTDPRSFVKGWLYPHVKTISFEPESLLRPDFVLPNFDKTRAETLQNDCLIYCINFIVRGFLFTRREQVERLTRDQMKKNSAIVQQKKVAEGTPVAVFFEPFFVIGDRGFFLSLITSTMTENCGSFMKRFILDNMYHNHHYSEVLFVGKGQHHITAEEFTHSTAFILQEVTSRNSDGAKMTVIMFDQNENENLQYGGNTLAGSIDFNYFNRFTKVI
jgi:hypothetical protein